MDTILSILNQSIREAANPGTAGVIIAMIGLNIHFGFTGLLNFGQAGFMLLGAYGFAVSIFRFDLPLVVAVLVALGCALIFALVLGAPTLKLRGDYLAIVTISAAEIIRFTGRLSNLKEYTGGALGLRVNQFNSPFQDLSFLPTTRFTLMPYNYTNLGADPTVVRSVGLLVFVVLVIAVIKLARISARAAGPAGSAAEVALLPVAALFAVLLTVLALAASESGSWTIVLLLSAAVAIVTFVFALRRVLAEKTPRSIVMPVLGAMVLSALAFCVLFFVFPLGYSTNNANGWWLRLVAWSLVLISTIIVALLVRSPWGRLLRGVREDEDAIRSLGKNVFAIKMQSLIIGGLFGAVGGIIFVLQNSVQADGLGRQITFFAYTALLLGGAATIFGPVLGGIIFFASRVLIKEIADAYVPASLMSSTDAVRFSFVVVGVILMMLIIFRPQGIMGDKRELRINV